jgi:preprotein translocase subunit SecB
MLSEDQKTGIVRLLCRIQSDSEGKDVSALVLSLKLQGFFGFDDEDKLPVEIKRELLGRNAVSVLFPYLRSAISTITQAAGIQPIVLPVINPTAIDEIGHSSAGSDKSADDNE